MLAMYLILISTVLSAFTAIIRKKIAVIDTNLNYLWAAVSQITTGLFVLLFSLLLGLKDDYLAFFNNLDAYLVIKIIISSSLWILSTILLFKAQHKVAISKYSIIESLGPVIAIGLAFLLLHESLNLQQILGMFLIFISVIAVVYEKNIKIWQISRPEQIAFLATFFSSLALVNDKGIFTNAPMTPALVVLFIIPGLIAFIGNHQELQKTKLIFQNKANLSSLIILSSVWALAAMTFYQALIISDSLSLMLAISQISVVLTVILGLVMLKETKNWKIKILASIVSFFGLVLINI